MGTSDAAAPVPRVVDLFGNRRLPVPLQPLPDELFSSWFTRLAKANGLRPHQLGQTIAGRGRQLFSGDIDRGVWSDPGSELASLTNTSKKLLEQTYLRAYVGYLWPDRPVHGVWRHVLHLANGNRTERSFGLQFCPQCLAQDSTPYFRKHWRLVFCVVCDVHGCELQDRCPHCKAPLVPHRSDIGEKRLELAPKITQCQFCRQSLLIEGHEVDTALLLDFQRLVLATLDRGWISIGGRSVHSVMFFEGLRMLLSFLDDERQSGQVHQVLGNCDEKKYIGMYRYGGIEACSLARRTLLMSMAGALLTDWPRKAMLTMKSAGVSSRKLIHFWRGPANTAPFWLWQPVKEYLDKTPYVPSDKEISNAANYLFRETTGPRIQDLCALLNMATNANARVAVEWRHRTATCST